MTDEDIVAALAEVVWKHDPANTAEEDMVAFLLPVVRRVAEQRAAEELRAAAFVLAITDRDTGLRIIRDRAAALTATPNHGTDATT